MFDELIRAAEELDGKHEIDIPVPLDAKRYYDRQCPSSSCRDLFKVQFDDWSNKVLEDGAICPFCGYKAPADEWNTSEQARYFESVAEEEMHRLVNEAFGEAVRRTKPRQISGGLFDVKMSLSYEPGQPASVVSIEASSVLRQDFVCEECQCRYASIGASFFCPACGHNSATSCFDNTMDTIKKTIAALPEMRESFEKDRDADFARDAIRQILEDQLPRIVGAFERINEALFQKLPNSSEFSWKGSVFQRLDEASTLWKEASGKGYTDILGDEELQQLKLMFQRRHVLSHRQGVVDQVYIDRSGDVGYAVGQRLVVADSDVTNLVAIVEKLVAGLRGFQSFWAYTLGGT